MSDYKAPRGKIELSEREKLLYAQLPQKLVHFGPEKWEVIADAMEELIESLEARNAIPEARIAIFNDANYAETGKKSIQQIFEQNGCSEIFRHPHFVNFLRYFIEGPDLPQECTSGLLKALDSIGTSGMIVKRTHQFARDMVRKYDLDVQHAGTQFYRLAVEIGMSPSEAKGLRKAAMQVR